MQVFLHPRVSSPVAGFPMASPCLWGKLENLSFCHVANGENCRMSRTKCSFYCIHASRLESLVFLWRRHVYGGSWKTCPFRMCPSRLSCRFAWQAWRFVTFQTCLIMFWKCQNWRKSRTKCCFFCIHVSCFESLVFLWRRCVYGGSWKTCPFRMCPSRLSCRFAWQAWHFVTFQTCLIMCWKCQNWRKPRTKCWFFCIHMSYLESLVFLWRRRVYGRSSAPHTLHFTLRTPPLTL